MAGYFENNNNNKLSGLKKADVSESIRLKYTLFRQESVQTVLSYKP
jgi:hypothetical protein